jgi:hypothetical protein
VRPDSILRELPKLHFHVPSREPAAWLHKNGKFLQVTSYSVPKSLGVQRATQFGEWKYIVATGHTLKPSIIRYRKVGRMEPYESKGAIYRIWIGVDGDENGFELVPSILKTRQPSNEDPVLSTRSKRGSKPTIL